MVTVAVGKDGRELEARAAAASPLRQYRNPVLIRPQRGTHSKTPLADLLRRDSRALRLNKAAMRLLACRRVRVLVDLVERCIILEPAADDDRVNAYALPINGELGGRALREELIRHGMPIGRYHVEYVDGRVVLRPRDAR